MRIESLAVRDFPPFANIGVNFPPKVEGCKRAEVHILTGQNGTGKTRLLSLLAASLGQKAELDSRIDGTKSFGGVIATSGGKVLAWFLNGNLGVVSANVRDQLAEHLPRGDTAHWIEHHHSNSKGFSALKSGNYSAMSFRGVAQISDAEVTALSPIQIKDPTTLLAFDKADEESKQVGQSLVNIKMAAAMDKLDDSRPAQTRATRLSDRLEETISDITGRRFRFSVTPYPKVSLKVTWGDTSMRFNQLPDGLRCIIGWLAACVAKLDALFPDHENPLEIPLILLLDEPEGHLHPAWQRKLIPAAQALFPNGQFFVATHSPFVISSVNEGWIHVLRADPNGVVSVDKPQECSKGDSYVEIVEEILGVKEWYDPETEKLLKEFRALKNVVLESAPEKETELRGRAKAIASRSETLNDMISGEMRQFERMKKLSPVGA